MIKSNEDIIDRRIRRSWRENQVKDYLCTINDYWHDINGWRSDYYAEGGSFVQLHKDIRSWDPSKGDKIEIRTRQNQWMNISYSENSNEMDPLGDGTGEVDTKKDQYSFWFDYPMGKVYIRLRLYQQRYNSFRITYRYGSNDPVPYAINRLCSLMTASQIMNMQAYNVKLGAGGNIAGIKDQMLKSWQEEMNTIWSSWQRCGTVKSMYR